MGWCQRDFPQILQQCHTNVGTWAIRTDHVLHLGVSALYQTLVHQYVNLKKNPAESQQISRFTVLKLMSPFFF